MARIPDNASIAPTKNREGSEQREQAPSLDLFFETIHAFYKTEALKAAIQLDLFSAVGEGADTVEALAARCNASERGVRILCDFLVLIGFLRKEKHNYQLTIDSKTFLDRKSPHFVGDSIQFLLSPTQTIGFKDLTSAVRKGTTILESGGVLAPDHPVWVTFAKAMTPILSMPCELLSSTLDHYLETKCKVLDVAAGHGLFGIAIAKRKPESRIVAVDWANILEVAEENARSAGVADRYSVIAGSALDVQFGGDYDLVLIPNFLHHFDPNTIHMFLGKVFQALKLGGRAAILEFILDESRTSPPVAVVFSVMMLATTTAGNAYSFSEYKKILEQVGFSKVDLHSLPPTYFRVVIAQK